MEGLPNPKSFIGKLKTLKLRKRESIMEYFSKIMVEVNQFKKYGQSISD